MSHPAVDAAAALAPLIRASRAETEASRQLPPTILDALIESGLCRLAIPESLGGLELDPLTALDVYEELAKAEASVAWIVWNCSLPSLFGRFVSDPVRREILGDASHIYASSTRPTGRAVRINGGYRISGRWSLVSGCLHAHWIALMFAVERDGEVEILDDGAPHLRLAYLPSESCEITDTWHVGGLRGTGSHDVTLEDVEVTAEHTFPFGGPSQLDRPIGRVPIASTMSAGHAAICLGIAETALEEVIELGRSKVTVGPAPRLPDRAANQFAVADAKTRIAALRAEVRRALGDVWETARAGDAPSHGQLGAVWSAAVTTGRSCRGIVSSLYEVAGTPSLYVDSMLERCHRDIHAAMQHIVAQRLWIEEAGRVEFGMDPSLPLFAV